MISEELQKKIEKSYEVLRVGGGVSKTYYHAPLVLTYSGGKDSDVLLRLAMECMKPDEFEVQNSHTTLDAPQTVYHIREVFKDLEAKGIKTTIWNKPTKNQDQTTIWDLMVKFKYPPTRFARYCCAELKENASPNRMIAVGVRAAESRNRQNRDSFQVWTNNKDKRGYFSLDHVKEVFAEAIEEAEDQKVPVETKSPWDCTFVRMAKENKKEVVNPIYEWTDDDVWDYINDRQIKVCELYSCGLRRIGCIGCPLANRKEQLWELSQFPQYEETIRKTMDKMIAARKAANMSGRWQTGEDMWLWWIQDPEYIKAHPSPKQAAKMKEQEEKRAARAEKRAAKEAEEQAKREKREKRRAEKAAEEATRAKCREIRKAKKEAEEKAKAERAVVRAQKRAEREKLEAERAVRRAARLAKKEAANGD